MGGSRCSASWKRRIEFCYVFNPFLYYFTKEILTSSIFPVAHHWGLCVCSSWLQHFPAQMCAHIANPVLLGMLLVFHWWFALSSKQPFRFVLVKSLKIIQRHFKIMFRLGKYHFQSYLNLILPSVRPMDIADVDGKFGAFGNSIGRVFVRSDGAGIQGIEPGIGVGGGISNALIFPIFDVFHPNVHHYTCAFQSEP